MNQILNQLVSWFAQRPKWLQDAEAVCAGLLHDVIEDGEISLETIRRIFGERVAFLVDGMSWERKWNFDMERYLKDWNGFHKKISEYSLYDPVVVIVHAADELSKLDDIMGRKFKKIDEKPEKTKKRYSRIMRFMVPFYKEIGLTKVSERVFEKIKDYADNEKSELGRFLTKSQLSKIRLRLSKIKGIKELR